MGALSDSHSAIMICKSLSQTFPELPRKCVESGTRLTPVITLKFNIYKQDLEAVEQKQGKCWAHHVLKAVK